MIAVSTYKTISSQCSESVVSCQQGANRGSDAPGRGEKERKKRSVRYAWVFRPPIWVCKWDKLELEGHVLAEPLYRYRGIGLENCLRGMVGTSTNRH